MCDALLANEPTGRMFFFVDNNPTGKLCGLVADGVDAP